MFDDSKIGRKIGSGGDQVVYRYGDDQVIKFSRFVLLGGIRVKEKLERDYEICREYFGEFVVEVEDVSPLNSRWYVEIQEFVDGKPLDLSHASHPDLMGQLARILKSQKQLLNAGFAPLDLIGHGGLFRPCLSNVLVDNENRLRIIDVLLAEAKTLWIGGALLLFPLKTYAMWRQRKTIHKMIGVADLKDQL